jgi:hypothetical protein
MDKGMVSKGGDAQKRKGTQEGGISNAPYFSKVFMVVNQMLFSIKANEVADRAIERLREGKKPLIAFSSTMGAFLDDMTDEDGETITVGDDINADFTEVLRRGLNGVMRYTITDARGKKSYGTISPDQLYDSGQVEYYRIQENIKNASTGISISPIDVIIQKITKAGYTVAEVTGRKYEVELDLEKGRGFIRRRKRLNTNDAFRKFNNNEADVLLINQSGATGASAHAVPTDKVSPSEVKPRVMIVLQAELNINTEVQKRGRINRTGQIFKPEYDYLSSAIPAEKRLMMMLQRKLKSLDANTSSNQKQSKTLLDYVDFLNKYGDVVVAEYLREHEDINDMIHDPLKFNDPTIPPNLSNAAHRVSGRIAILPVKMQQSFYDEMIDRYSNYVDYIKQAGFYDLEVEVLDFQAETLESKVFIAGKGGHSPFSGDTNLDKCMVNVLRKPLSKSELDEMVSEVLLGKAPEQYKLDLIDESKEFNKKIEMLGVEETRLKYRELKDQVAKEPRVKKKKPEEREKVIAQVYSELDKKLSDEIEYINKVYKLRLEYMNRIFRFFTPGRGLIYTVKDATFGEIRIPAVFVGYLIDRKKPNPFLPSAMKLRFAMSDSSRYMTMAVSFSDHINQIMGSSSGMGEDEVNNITENWQEHTASANVNRTQQYIVTGNLLQAYGRLRGKLVSYTTIKGNQKKGILIPNMKSEDFKKIFKNIFVPIIRALPLIKSMVMDELMSISGDMFFTRTKNGYKLTVSGSKAKGGDYYLNEKLLAVLTEGTFNKTGTKMVSEIDTDDIERVVDVMQMEFNSSVSVPEEKFKFIKGNSSDRYEEEAPLSSELVSLEAKLMLMLSHSYTMNGADELLAGARETATAFDSIPTPSKCNSIAQVFDALIQVQDLMLQHQAKKQHTPEFLLMRYARLKGREMELRTEELNGSDYHPRIKYLE